MMLWLVQMKFCGVRRRLHPSEESMTTCLIFHLSCSLTFVGPCLMYWWFPPGMHINRGILENCVDWIYSNIHYPVGRGGTKTVARSELRCRLERFSHLHPRYKQWNNTSYRLAFSCWLDLFHGLLSNSQTPVPFMASVVYFILNSPEAEPTSKRLATLLSYSFLLPRLIGWQTSNLYWHCILHLVPVLQLLKIPACSLSDEHFESVFRPAKHVLRRSEIPMGQRNDGVPPFY